MELERGASLLSSQVESGLCGRGKAIEALQRQLPQLGARVEHHADVRVGQLGQHPQHGRPRLRALRERVKHDGEARAGSAPLAHLERGACGKDGVDDAVAPRLRRPEDALGRLVDEVRVRHDRRGKHHSGGVRSWLHLGHLDASFLEAFDDSVDPADGLKRNERSDVLGECGVRIEVSEHLHRSKSAAIQVQPQQLEYSPCH